MRIDEIIDPADDPPRCWPRTWPAWPTVASRRPRSAPSPYWPTLLSPARRSPGRQSVARPARGSASAGASILGTKWAINVATAATPMMMSARQ